MSSPFNILSNSSAPPVPPPDVHPRPDWLRVRFFGGERFQDLKRLMRTLDLHTVCESARCPNMGECWEHGAATFMILGDICTRACGFCAVPSGKPAGPPDENEPYRVADAVEKMGLRYAVVTSVNRDGVVYGVAFSGGPRRYLLPRVAYLPESRRVRDMISSTTALLASA